MGRNRRSSSPEMIRHHLEQKKADLDASVAALSERKFLSTSEAIQEKELKKRKLAMKDALSRL